MRPCAYTMLFLFKKMVYLLQIKTNMAFAIISSILALFQFGIYCVAVDYKTCYKLDEPYSYICSPRYYYTDHATNIAFHAILLITNFAEFIISLTAAIYCCKYGGCCGNSTGGVSSTYFISLLAKVPRLPWEVNSCCIF